ncbi:MAG: LamG domain-containing protein, partial [Planctomycetota bacterium]
SFIGEGANLGNFFNLGNDVSIRKDNGSVQGATAAHPDDEFFVRAARMNAASINQWFNTTGTLESVHEAGGASYTTSTDNFYLGDLRADSTDGGGTSGYSTSDIEIAEVVVYNKDLSDAQIEGINEWLQGNVGSGGGNPLAAGPAPADGVLYENTWANLGWRAGYYAVSHDLYFGTAFDDVNDGAEGTFVGNTGTTSQVVGFPGFPAAEGLQPGTTYYWRVDEVNEADPNSPWKGHVWSFTVPPKIAYNPEPADGVKFVEADLTLTWTAGFGTKLHDVYFGDDFDTVSNASGALPQADTTYSPGALESDKTYYWRVDEFDGATRLKGDVWSFTTMPVIEVTGEPNLVGMWTFDEGMGNNALDWSGNGNHGKLFGTDWTAPGVIGDAALDLNGGYVAIQNLSYNSTDNTEVTVCVWLRTNSWATQRVVSFDRNEYWRLEINGNGGGDGQIGWDVMTSTGLVDSGSITRVDDEIWHHVCGVFDNGRMTIYIDGIAEPSVTGGPTFGSGNTRFGFISAESDASSFNGTRGGGSSVFGDIDDVRIYNRALTQEEIVLVMRGDPLMAWTPSPADGSTPDIDNATSLSWSAGDMASQHDVYFGTDRDAVASADTSDGTGIYRGSQSGTSFTPAEGIEWGSGPYYWRIDEKNTDGTVTKGRVWTFAVADFILVDDFEGYTDNDAANEAIWQSWIDGFDAPTNGSQVGYMLPPYAEQTIVHGGGQSMPLSYDNSAGAAFSEAELKMTAPRNWTNHGVGVLSLWFRGYPATVGSFTEGPAGMFTITASGADISGTADQFHFAYKTLTGPGTIVARVDSVEDTHSWAKAGVMIRETLDAGSKHAFACVTPGHGVASQGRTGTDTGSFNSAQADITAPHWVKLERDVAGNFTVSHSANGTIWEPVGSAVPTNISMTSSVYIGLAVTSHNGALTCEAKFSNVTITGTVGPQWAHQDIGILANSAEPLYVALANSNGTSGVVVHDDPEAATIDTWTEWLIDLQVFADQGVNLTDVDSIAIGLGTKGNATGAGGSGMLFIDDVRLYQPAN